MRSFFVKTERGGGVLYQRHWRGKHNSLESAPWLSPLPSVPVARPDLRACDSPVPVDNNSSTASVPRFHTSGKSVFSFNRRPVKTTESVRPIAACDELPRLMPPAFLALVPSRKESPRTFMILDELLLLHHMRGMRGEAQVEDDGRRRCPHRVGASCSIIPCGKEPLRTCSVAPLSGLGAVRGAPQGP